MQLVVVTSSGLEMGELTWKLGVGLLSILLTMGLIIKKYRAAFVISILSATIVIGIGEAILGEFELRDFETFDISPIAFKLNFDFRYSAFYLIPVMLVNKPALLDLAD
jgi:xanthine/uracil/vitamin C permease (AzgA family)